MCSLWKEKKSKFFFLEIKKIASVAQQLLGLADWKALAAACKGLSPAIFMPFTDMSIKGVT